jgi:hypothetical protein
MIVIETQAVVYETDRGCGGVEGVVGEKSWFYLRA